MTLRGGVPIKKSHRRASSQEVRASFFRVFDPFLTLFYPSKKRQKTRKNSLFKKGQKLRIFRYRRLKPRVLKNHKKGPFLPPKKGVKKRQKTPKNPKNPPPKSRTPPSKSVVFDPFLGGFFKVIRLVDYLFRLVDYLV